MIKSHLIINILLSNFFKLKIRLNTQILHKNTKRGLALIAETLYLKHAPGEIRTPDLLVRSQTLYPTELQAQVI